ncbi:MAG: hypothetical protein GWO24_32430, partial [Akkermansiaceae bacterium]|nr:hypothetical protein [Akkermansiaceae bacterium]
MTRLVSCRTGLQWNLTNSRRTPAGFLDQLAALPLQIHPCDETGPDWLPQQLLTAREVWVTEDSMSMIYEALTARARVGLLAMPRKSRRGRIVRGLDQLVTG